MDETMRAPVVMCDTERDRWPDERLQLRRGALRDLEWDVNVGPERAVVAVILGGADRDDDRTSAALEVLPNREVRHFRHEQRALHLLLEPERVQVLARAAHRFRHLREWRPRLALKLELDRVRTDVAGVAQDREDAGEIDRAAS